MYVCMCTGVTSNQIEKLLEDGTVKTREDIQAQTGAGSGCGCCRETVEQMVDEFENSSKETFSSDNIHPTQSKELFNPIPLSVQVLRPTPTVSELPISKPSKP